MSLPTTMTFVLAIPGTTPVTAKLDAPAERRPGSPALLLAHGSRNDLDHPLLAFMAARLPVLAEATVLRFNFPYAERGGDAPDSQGVLEAAFKAAYTHLVAETDRSGGPVFVGGKSLGGRVAAELVSRRIEGDGVAAAGLVELGYPLHAPGRTDRPNLKPLRHIDVPSLFCIGSRDPFCDLDLFRPLVPRLTRPGELYVVDDGDHSMQLPRSSGRAANGAYEALATRVAEFLGSVAS
jgi:predicted alpha/beta-hydrolase family hydrolase